MAVWKAGGTGKQCRMQLEAYCPLVTAAVTTRLSCQLVNPCPTVLAAHLLSVSTSTYFAAVTY